MFGRKYRLNPDTLRVEEVKPTRRVRLFRLVLTVSVLIVLSVIIRLSYDQFAKTPRYIYYEKKNDQLRQEYLELNEQLKVDEEKLALLRQKDDRLYRSIFGLEPLPSSIREAGTGGSPRYRALQSISDPEVVINVFDKMEKLSTRVQIQSSSFDYLEETARKNQKLLACKPSIQPISPEERYWLTSSYGYRKDPFTGKRRAHHGIDLAGRTGMNIYSTGDGKVISAGYNGHGYGNDVIIDHGFGYRSRYSHLKEIQVKTGQRVKRGEVIGTLGNTGRSTGPHLHYEVHHNGRALNPLYFYFENITPEEFNLIVSRAGE